MVTAKQPAEKRILFPNILMQNKLIYICIYVFLAVFISCQKTDINYYKNISDEYLMSLSTRNGFYVDVVIPVKSNKIFVMVAPLLLYTYEQHYTPEYPTDFDFLRALYNGKIQDIEQYLNNYEKIEVGQSIMKEYKKYGLNYMIDKYLTGSEEKYYTFQDTIDFTIAKIMFTNNYYLYYDDYTPTYYFKLKLDDLALPEDW